MDDAVQKDNCRETNNKQTMEMYEKRPLNNWNLKIARSLQ